MSLFLSFILYIKSTFLIYQFKKITQLDSFRKNMYRVSEIKHPLLTGLCRPFHFLEENIFAQQTLRRTCSRFSKTKIIVKKLKLDGATSSSVNRK